jgi:heme-degrading monooxygenase HmoA
MLDAGARWQRADAFRAAHAANVETNVSVRNSTKDPR